LTDRKQEKGSWSIGMPVQVVSYEDCGSLGDALWQRHPDGHRQHHYREAAAGEKVALGIENQKRCLFFISD
jgi:hypothetical protein